MNKNDKGFSLVEALLVIAVLAIIGLLGWNFFNRQAANNTSKTSTSNNSTVEATLPAVNSKEDLKTAEDAINAIDIDGAINTSDIDASLE
jgi:prepilin-type N-terminal cleavage/methylation domain-containing protein